MTSPREIEYQLLREISAVTDIYKSCLKKSFTCVRTLQSIKMESILEVFPPLFHFHSAWTEKLDGSVEPVLLPICGTDMAL